MSTNTNDLLHLKIILHAQGKKVGEGAGERGYFKRQGYPDSLIL
jgi:hypothetical protein